MGAKITVDSATLANKALEVIEAHFLFGLGYQQIDVVVHPQSIVHAFVEFLDGSVLAQVGFPTMEIPILYALTHPDRLEDTGTRPFDPVHSGSLTFEAVRRDCFPTFQLGVDAGRAGGTAPAAFNAANEVAVAAFLSRRIPFGRMATMIEAAMTRHQQGPADALESVLAADAAARAHAEEAT
jgi:1-deoxy-D-xylulose-5-phosphate reductoisomerase